MAGLGFSMGEGCVRDGVVEREAVARGAVVRGAMVAGARPRVLGVTGREFTDAVLVFRTEEGVRLLVEKEVRVVELLLAILGQ